MEKLPLTHGGDRCEQLYRNEHARILRLCHSVLLNRHEAEDVVQEVFLRLLRAREANTPILSWSAWLTTVALNACRDRQRSGWWKWCRGNKIEQVAFAWLVDTDTPEEQLLSRELRRRLLRRLHALSPRQREVFVLRRLKRLSTDAAARALGLTNGTVKRHLFHATRRLQHDLSE